MRTSRELRALCRRIDALELDTREIILAYAIGPKLVDTASGALSRHVHANLVHLLMCLCKSHAAEFAMDYSRRCVDSTRRIILQHSRDESIRSSQDRAAHQDRAARILAVERWLDYPSATVDTLIFVRLEAWGDITVLQVQWSDDTTPYQAVEIRYLFQQNSIVVRSRRVEFLFDDVPDVSLERPTRDTVRSMNDLTSILFQFRDAVSSVGLNPFFDGYLVPRLLLLSYDDWRVTGRHRQSAYQYDACEWVYGL